MPKDRLDAHQAGALAPALKQQVPSLTYGAHNFSSDPAKRAVVINGRELREGSEVAPGVLLVAIAPAKLKPPRKLRSSCSRVPGASLTMCHKGDSSWRSIST